VQGCERFAFTAMLPLFVLYLHHRHGFSEPTALLILGVFNGLSYVSGLPGGMLTDRKLGPAVGLIMGASLLTAGYGALATDRSPLLWPACALLVLGHGLFRPGMATLLGSLFPSIDSRREHGFLWQYLAINIACVVGPLCAGFVIVEHRWRGLFLLATAAMVVGTLILTIWTWVLRPLPQPLATDAGSSAAAANPTTRWRAVWLLCTLAVVFWLTALQAGGSLALFAEEYTLQSITVLGRSMAIGPTQFASLHGLLVLALLPLFLASSTRRRRRPAEPSTPVKMVWGYVATAAAFILLAAAGLHGGDTSRVNPGWLTGCYLLLSVAELLLGPFGMSLVTQTAPPNRTGQAVGLWFAAAAVGNVAAGGLGLLWGRWPNHRYFALLALASLGAAVVLLTRLSSLERLINASRTNPEGGRR
jgi:POT family proton-dependent oligopeptide transporter